MLKSEKYPHLLLNSNAAQFKESDEGGLNLGQVAAILRRRILLIIGITGLIATAAVLKAETDPPVYQGTFEILTKPVTGESKVIADVPQAINSQDGVSAGADSKNSIFTTITVVRILKTQFLPRLQFYKVRASSIPLLKNCNLSTQN